MHPVFHVSQLKKQIVDNEVIVSLPSKLAIEAPSPTLPETILSWRILTCDGQSIPQCLIKWHDPSIDDATWMFEANLKGQFPDFSLEDMLWLKRVAVIRHCNIRKGPETRGEFILEDQKGILRIWESRVSYNTI